MPKEIIILAKSFKRGGYCIAGIDTETGEWIRPISDDAYNEGAVPRKDIIYPNGEELEIFDKVSIELISYSPTKAQPENYVYVSNIPWRKTGISSLQQVLEFRGYDKADKIFYNTNRAVTEREIGGQPSLMLLNVRNSCISIINSFGKKKIQLNCDYNGYSYEAFRVSDELVISKYKYKADGNYPYKGNMDVVFSLTDKYYIDGKYYKMAAQLFNNY